MNIETVNELITSLQSAGELSIKERKYLDIMRWAVGVAGERDAALNAERVWETAMMEVCGEDGPASVASEIRSLRALRDTAIQALKSQVEQMAAENVAMKAGVAEEIEVINRGGQRYCVKDGMSINPIYARGWNDHRANVTAVQTPATDRIVAGIKAEAKSHDLNAFISHYSAELDNHIANGGDQFDERAVRLRGVIVGARMFREKLRDEEKALALREGAK